MNYHEESFHFRRSEFKDDKPDLCNHAVNLNSTSGMKLFLHDVIKGALIIGCIILIIICIFINPEPFMYIVEGVMIVFLCWLVGKMYRDIK